MKPRLHSLCAEASERRLHPPGRLARQRVRKRRSQPVPAAVSPRRPSDPARAGGARARHECMRGAHHRPGCGEPGGPPRRRADHGLRARLLGDRVLSLPVRARHVAGLAARGARRPRRRHVAHPAVERRRGGHPARAAAPRLRTATRRRKRGPRPRRVGRRHDRDRRTAADIHEALPRQRGHVPRLRGRPAPRRPRAAASADPGRAEGRLPRVGARRCLLALRRTQLPVLL